VNEMIWKFIDAVDEIQEGGQMIYGWKWYKA
jgi:hypothetical protein